MRTYDFAPLWRSSIGFDRLFDLINDTQRLDGQDNYPPYDIVRTGEDTYRISLALAGFAPDEIAITAQQNKLTISGRKADQEAEANPIISTCIRASRLDRSSGNSTSKIMSRSSGPRSKTGCCKSSLPGRSRRR